MARTSIDNKERLDKTQLQRTFTVTKKQQIQNSNSAYQPRKTQRKIVVEIITKRNF